jgi:hypothetical protein
MPPEPSVSYPSSIEADGQAAAAAPVEAPGTTELAAGTTAARVVLGAWALFVYLVYWLGYLGLR